MTSRKPTVSPTEAKPAKKAPAPFVAIDIHPDVPNMAALRGAVEIVMNAKTVRNGSGHAAD